MGRWTELLKNKNQEAPVVVLGADANPVEDAPPGPEVASAIPVATRGRPRKWVERPLSEADRTRGKDFVKKYGPDVRAVESFECRYSTFCELNSLDKTEYTSLELCVGQALECGAAVSSLKTMVEGLLKRKKIPIRGGWVVLCALKKGHADSDDVQPRTVVGTQESLEKILQTLENENLPERFVLWLCFATGMRAADATWLRFSQLKLTESQVWIQRRVTKVCHDRSKRKEMAFDYSWSSAPKKELVAYWKARASSTATIVEGHLNLSKSRIAGTVTRLLRKGGGGPKITSYVFRDYMDAHLRSDINLEASLVDRLLDHSSVVAEASYTRSVVAPIKKGVATKDQASKTKSAKAKNARKAKVRPIKKRSRK